MAEMTARLDHVGLAVADLGAAAAWYCDVFGLAPELSLRVDAIDLSIEMLIHPAFGYRVELLHRPPSAPRPAAFSRTQRIAATTSSCGTGYVTPPVHSR